MKRVPNSITRFLIEPAKNGTPAEEVTIQISSQNTAHVVGLDLRGGKWLSGPTPHGGSFRALPGENVVRLSLDFQFTQDEGGRYVIQPSGSGGGDISPSEINQGDNQIRSRRLQFFVETGE